jgi:choline-sulfatase
MEDWPTGQLKALHFGKFFLLPNCRIFYFIKLDTEEINMSSKPMNLLFILSDEHNPSMMGSSGHPVVKTPNLDELSKQGTRFKNAYCNFPICVPSRASLATGRYAHKIGSWDNASPYIGEIPSWGHRLTEQGHRVTTIGKLHYRQDEDDTGFPDKRLSMQVLDGFGDIYSLIRDNMATREGRNKISKAGPGDSSYTRYDRAITNEAVQFLQNEANNSDNPWVLFVSFVSPHPPLTAPKEYYDMYPLEDIDLPLDYTLHTRPNHPVIDEYRRVWKLDEELDEHTIRKGRAAYYGLCSFLDAQIGEVLNALRESGLADSTRIIYTSDHGDNLGEHGLWFKSSMYDASVSVPFIISGPDIPKGNVVENNISLIDCFPTIVDAVGAELAEEDRDLPGVSLLELARGETNHQRTVFSEYHAAGSIAGTFMIRGERYKYIHYVNYAPQLFDLKEDPHELNNLAENEAYREVLADCERQLRTIVNPEEVDLEARKDQQRRLDEYGGRDHVIGEGLKITDGTPVPSQFH